MIDMRLSKPVPSEPLNKFFIVHDASQGQGQITFQQVLHEK